ncbi:unnamed protein product [Phytophthora fragariaefolia]|uniref:Unnamed protein product n=1 Tax=Phytophthora fragariaefolia TaxID=1490495 RepID=A0A9W7CWR9_9STRA|nr:unnamed protein product [Phytophthora fragariaefolia]
MDATRGRGKNEQITLSPEQVHSFEELKRLLSEPPTLAHPDSSRPFHVRMDASDYAVGGFLYQVDEAGKEQVISYGGRKLGEAEKMYPTREKELLAALHAMRLWRVYLIDKPFFVNTDHRTLQSILEQKTCSQRLARWLNELGSYRSLFRWIPGTSNVVADAISRILLLSLQNQLNTCLLQQLTSQHDEPTADEAYSHYMAARPSIAQQCIRLYPKDSTYGLLYAHLSTRIDPSTPPPVEVPRQLRANLRHFFIEDGLLYYQSNADLARRLCVPADVDLRNAILFEHHDSATSGHLGYLKTLMALQERFYWPRMDRAVRRYVASCEMCQRIRVSQRKAAGLLHPLEVPTNRWTHITMDFVTGLPCGRRSKLDAIMVVVDRLTKRAHFILTTTTYTAKEAARLFRDHYQRLHGLPLSIVSDRDFKFTSKFWSELMSFQRTQLQLCSAFRPETDRQTEKTNHFVADYIRAFVNARHDDWDEMLSLAEVSYDARVHSSIGMAPFTADLGYIPRSAADLASPSLRGRRSHAVKFVEHQKVLLQQCKDMLEKSQATMKYFHDRNRPTYQFAEGDQVLLDTSNLDLHHLGTAGKRKLAPRFIGPYPVVKPTTPDTYQLGLPPGLRLHDEFHVWYLRPYVFDSNPRRLNDVPRLITRESYEGLQVQAILQRRVRKGKVEFKVRWYGRDNKDSWEPEDNLEQAPGLIERFHLTQPHRSTRQRSIHCHPAAGSRQYCQSHSLGFELTLRWQLDSLQVQLPVSRPTSSYLAAPLSNSFSILLSSNQFESQQLAYNVINSPPRSVAASTSTAS